MPKDRKERAGIPDGHRIYLAQASRRVRLVYGVAWLGLALEVGLGAYIWSKLRAFGAGAIASAPLWWTVLGGLAVAQAGAAFWARRALGRAAPLYRRLAEAWRSEGRSGKPPLEILTAAALRAGVVADVIAWVLLQFITIYGLVALVILGSVAPLVVFPAFSAMLLLLAAPRQQRLEGLAAGLHDAAVQ
jgi:hypothetical protein